MPEVKRDRDQNTVLLLGLKQYLTLSSLDELLGSGGLQVLEEADDDDILLLGQSLGLVGGGQGLGRGSAVLLQPINDALQSIVGEKH